MRTLLEKYRSFYTRKDPLSQYTEVVEQAKVLTGYEL
jgi:hypothetical protein